MKPPFGLSDIQARILELSEALDATTYEITTIPELVSVAERICGQMLPGAAILRFAGGLKKLGEPHLEFHPLIAAEAASEVDAFSLSRDLGTETENPALSAGHISADLLSVLRICALQNATITYQEPEFDSFELPTDPIQEEHANQLAERRQITSLLSHLTPRQERVLRMRNGIGVEELTLEQIGEAFGVTRERIRQIESKALTRCRDLLRRTSSTRLFYRVTHARPATLDLASHLCKTPAELLVLLQQVGLCRSLMESKLTPTRFGDIPPEWAAQVELAVEIVRSGHIPNTVKIKDFARLLGCSKPVVSELVADGFIVPVVRNNELELGDLFKPQDAIDILARLSSAPHTGRRTKTEVVTIRRAATQLGWTLPALTSHILRHPEFVADVPDPPAFSTIAVDLEGLREAVNSTTGRRAKPPAHDLLVHRLDDDLGGESGAATLRLAKTVGITPLELIPLFHQIGLCLDLPASPAEDPKRFTARVGGGIEKAARKVLLVDFPGTITEDELRLRIGCDGKVLAGFVAEGHLRPVMKANLLGLGDRFRATDADRILGRYASLLGRRQRGFVDRMSIERAAFLLGYAERDVALHVLTHPDLVTKIGKPATYPSIWVDIDRLSRSIERTNRRRTGPDLHADLVKSEATFQRQLREDERKDERKRQAELREELNRREARQKELAGIEKIRERNRQAIRADLARLEKRQRTKLAQRLRKLETQTKRELARQKKTQEREMARALKLQQQENARFLAMEARRQEDEIERRVRFELRREAPPTAPTANRRQGGRGIEFETFAITAHLSKSAVKHLLKANRLRTDRLVPGRLDRVVAQEFLRLYVSAREIIATWPKGKDIVGLLRMAEIPPEFSAPETGVELYLRGYVTDIADSLYD